MLYIFIISSLYLYKYLYFILIIILKVDQEGIIYPFVIVVETESQKS